MPAIYKTAVRNSDVAGRGLFALEDIPAGAHWWVADEGVKGVPCEGFTNLPIIVANKDNIKDVICQTPRNELEDLLMYSMYYHDGDVLMILRDGCGVVNHSNKPNSKLVLNPEGDWKKLKSVALRDIKAGEEILENYSLYSKKNVEWIEEVYRQYLPERIEFETVANIQKEEST